MLKRKDEWLGICLEEPVGKIGMQEGHVRLNTANVQLTQSGPKLKR